MTNMYETVIWVALVAAVLSLILEMIYRKVFIALAGSAVALLGTITAANVPLLDPSIKSLQPVLRSNFWLSTHVLVRGLELRGVRPGVDARPDRNDLLSDRHLPPLASIPRAGPSAARGTADAGCGGAGVAASYGLFGPHGRWAPSPSSSSSQPRLAATRCSISSRASRLLGEAITLAGPARDWAARS